LGINFKLWSTSGGGGGGGGVYLLQLGVQCSNRGVLSRFPKPFLKEGSVAA